ncbi:MAG: hypothetical protein ACPHBQ_04610, partial [Candidatus Poseidoniaceae archaeon]
DDNGYLKKAEFVEAAKAFTEEGEDDSSDDSDSDETAEEEATEEPAAAEEVVEESTEAKDCPICGTSNAHDASACIACNYTFE